MKKIIILSVLLTVAMLSVNAQTINDIPIQDIDVEFVQIVGTAKMMNPNKVTIAVNFGQENKVFSGKDDGIIKDETGNKVVFFTMIDALNFMSTNGYDFVDAYTVTIGQSNVYHYLLKKEE